MCYYSSSTNGGVGLGGTGTSSISESTESLSVRLTPVSLDSTFSGAFDGGDDKFDSPDSVIFVPFVLLTLLEIELRETVGVSKLPLEISDATADAVLLETSMDVPLLLDWLTKDE